MPNTGKGWEPAPISEGILLEIFMTFSFFYPALKKGRHISKKFTNELTLPR